ncbi:hypothetical protein M5689_017978 [Euphorbia peplus]|nr:hypothetical protein M5689_017978 [Euphorbia peplus]
MVLVQGLFEAFRMRGKGNQNQDEYEYNDEDFGNRKDGPSSNMNKESSFAFATKFQMPNSLAVLEVDPSMVKEAASLLQIGMEKAALLLVPYKSNLKLEEHGVLWSLTKLIKIRQRVKIIDILKLYYMFRDTANNWVKQHRSSLHNVGKGQPMQRRSHCTRNGTEAVSGSYTAMSLARFCETTAAGSSQQASSYRRRKWQTGTVPSLTLSTWKAKCFGFQDEISVWQTATALAFEPSAPSKVDCLQVNGVLQRRDLVNCASTRELTSHFRLFQALRLMISLRSKHQFFSDWFIQITLL